MPGWREMCELVRDIRELVRGDWLFMWFLAPATGVLLALILWLSWLSDMVLAITGSERWGMLTNTPEGLAIIAGFAALTAGHMLNAWMTRRRDDRLRDEETKALAAALSAETALMSDSADLLNMQLAALARGEPVDPLELWRPPMSIFNKNTGRLGLLGTGISYLVALAYSHAETISNTVHARRNSFANEKQTARFLQERVAFVKKLAHWLASSLHTISTAREPTKTAEAMASQIDPEMARARADAQTHSN